MLLCCMYVMVLELLVCWIMLVLGCNYFPGFCVLLLFFINSLFVVTAQTGSGALVNLQSTR